MLEVNKLYLGDAIEILPQINGESIDLVLCSPPYDKIRNYSGAINSFKFEPLALEIIRVLKLGGIIIWVVNDQYINGSRSLTSFKQCLFFKEQCGLNVHDIMIYQKSGFNFPANNRYHQTYEYMLCLSKGTPKTFNPLLDRKNKYPGQKAHGRHRGHNENDYKDMSQIVKAKPIGEYGKRTNVWYYKVGGGNVTKDKIAYKHPAIFPEELAKDHILSWTNPSDIVLDPLAGSGTTLKMAKLLNRNWLGIEVNPSYYNIAMERLNNAPQKQKEKEMLSLPSSSERRSQAEQ